MVIHIAEVHRALENGEFFPYFQPLVQLRSGQLAGFEVLARWNHPEAGMIPPDVFIPLAERDGWIHALTHEIFSKAFACGCSVPKSLLLSVNISPFQLRDPMLTTQIQVISQRTGFPMERVMVEITESALAENLDQARRVVDELKGMGCKLALDDFGTGYSSLRHLQSLPFDELKVDRSFVSSMTQQRESRKIVEAVVGLGQSLGLTTVAEGVETEEQAEMLLWLGCDLAQGWLCGRPGPAEGLAAAISRPWPGASISPAFAWKDMGRGNLEGLPAQKLAQLRAIYDGAPVGLALLDRNLKHVNLNQQLAQLTGLSVEEHLGRTPAETVPELFPQFEPALHRALQGEAIAGFEVRIPAAPPDPEKTLLCTYQPARDEAGEVVGVSVALVDFTERKRAEERLRQYERVVEGLEEMVVVVDREYRYVLANRAFLEYRDLTAEQLIGRTLQDLLPDESLAVVKAKLDECFAGKVVKYELQYTYPKLGERNLSIAYFPIEISGGITGAACVLRDMTELKRMAEANQNWQKRVELAQQAGLRIGLWDWDVEANTVVWSDETYRQFGFARHAFSGRVEDAVTRIHPADLPRVQQVINAVLTGQNPGYQSQYRVVRPDGSICWIDAYGVMVQDGSAHMLGVGVDITDLKKVEESFRESEEKYRLLLNSTAEAIYGLDMKGNCTFCNPAGLRLLGYEIQEDLLGKNMHALMHHTRDDGRPYPIDECAIYAAIRQGAHSHVANEKLWRADGTSFPGEYWSYPIHKAGELVGAVVTFLDISDRMRAEQALSQSEEKYRGLFENATYGIFRAKVDGTLLDVNPAIIKLLGYGSKEELLVKNLNHDIYLDSAVSARLLQRLECERCVAGAIVQWKRKDGRTVAVRLTGRAIPDKDSPISAIEVTVEEMTKDQM